MIEHFEEELIEKGQVRKVKYGLKSINFSKTFLPKYFEFKELQY